MEVIRCRCRPNARRFRRRVRSNAGRKQHAHELLGAPHLFRPPHCRPRLAVVGRSGAGVAPLLARRTIARRFSPLLGCGRRLHGGLGRGRGGGGRGGGGVGVSWGGGGGGGCVGGALGLGRRLCFGGGLGLGRRRSRGGFSGALGFGGRLSGGGRRC